MNRLLYSFNKKKVKDNELLIWWLGGASFYLKSKDKKIIIDPYLTNSVYDILKPLFNEPEKELNRLKKPPLKPEEVDCDYYICTHDHLDHLDPYTVRGINDKENTIFIGPESCGKHFKKLGIPGKNIITLRRKESINLTENFSITAVDAKHRGPLDIRESLKLKKEIYGRDDGQGYILSIGSIRIYHTSDTEYLGSFKNLENSDIDIALLGANGKAGNMTLEEGTRLVEIIEPKVAILMHYGIIPFTDSSPLLFKKLFKKIGSKTELKILNTCDFYIYKKDTYESVN